MKGNRKYEELISAYLDGMLSNEEIKFVEEELLSDPEWMKYYTELQRIKNRLGKLAVPVAQKPMWITLVKKVRDKETEQNILLPKRLVPVAVVLLVMVVGLSSFMVVRNWDAVTAYYYDKRGIIEDIYEHGIVEGALRPLFAGITNDDIMRFALSGTLSIPEARGQALRVDSESPDQYQLEITDVADERMPPSLAQVYDQLDITPLQKSAIDSVLSIYRERIAESAFVVEDREMMVSLDLAGMDKFILVSIAEHLKPQQRSTFNTLLADFNPKIQVPELDERLPQITFVGKTPIVPSVIEEIGEMKIAAATHFRPFVSVKPEVSDPSKFVVEVRKEGITIPEKQITRPPREPKPPRPPLHNVRIQITPGDHPSTHEFALAITTEVGENIHVMRTPGAVTRVDTVYVPHFEREYFEQLRELTKNMQLHIETMRERIPQFAFPDTFWDTTDLPKLREEIRQEIRRQIDRSGQAPDRPQSLIVHPDSILLKLNEFELALKPGELSATVKDIQNLFERLNIHFEVTDTLKFYIDGDTIKIAIPPIDRF